ncbi:MAG: hypothetical protein OXU54_06780 [Gammaproteobacteria bacterium]|nr:hypothetical protein [Gammaproteobacteria bacterium]
MRVKSGAAQQMPKNTESIVNAALAAALREKNPHWRVAAEQTAIMEETGRRPDIVLPGSAPVVIETEFPPARTVEEDAKARLGKGLANSPQSLEQVLALRLPERLRTCPQEELPRAVAQAEYEYCLYGLARAAGAAAPGAGARPEASRWPSGGWLRGGVSALAGLLENAGLSERLVADSLQTLEAGVGEAARLLRAETRDHPDINRNIAGELHQEDSPQTSRMAMAIVANALTFQTLIAGAHRIRTLDRLRLSSGVLSKREVLREWDRILDEINYWPIFGIARRLLLPVPAGLAARILDLLAQTSDALAANGVTRSHDLYGRLFQRLIGDRKFLATFYTLPPAATLLAELAADSLQGVDWGDAEALKKLRIGDLACGTGTLLAAAYSAVLARFRHAGGDDARLHKDMMGASLVAADIMPAATHLTASMLSSLHPTRIFRRTQVHTLPYGISGADPRPYIGALDFIDREHGVDVLQEGIGLRVAAGEGPARGMEHEELVAANFALRHESMDLIIMNPPFTRPTNHEVADVPVPSFAGFDTSEKEQRFMAARLAVLRRQRHEPAGHGNAGLASYFIDLADAKLRPNGVLALVLPLAFAQGGSWANSRALLARNYEDIRVFSIAAVRAHDKAFSADTGMGEVLVLARKMPRKRLAAAPAPDPRIHWIALRRRPATAMEATELARQAGALPNGVEDAARLAIGADLAGTSLRAPLSQGGCAAVADAELVRAAVALESGQLRLPRGEAECELPTAKLAALGDRGLLHRDINGKQPDGSPRGPFDIVPPNGGYPTYPCLWRHAAEEERQLIVRPDTQGIARSGMRDKAERVWHTATRLHFNLDFQLNSQSLAACMTSEPALGGSAWPNYRLQKPGDEHAVALWANTTLGLLSFWWKGVKQQAGRARLTITALPELVTLDPRALDAGQKRKARQLFQEFASRAFLPANEAYRDKTRQALDRAVLVELLGFPKSVLEPLALLRKKWCAEPTVHGGKATRIREEGR